MRNIFGKHSIINYIKKSEINEKTNEMDIYYYIRTNKIPIKYDPRRDRKMDILKKLREKGYI